MESNSMSNNLQSAYKKFHSTESALLKVENDVLLNMEKGRVTALTLLDLSAAFDTIDHLTQISQTCKICFHHIRDFRRIRKYLSPEAAKSVACALVTSHLDYCNSLLYNLPDRDIERLQRVQNCLARVVCKASRFSRSKPLLNFLHWLPVKYRIRFKLCTITFKAFLFHQPTYLFNYLVPLQNSRLLRSSNTNMLTVPRFRTKWGSRAFAVADPSTWNSLPVNLRTASTVTSFKKMLKTFLFDSAFPPLIPRRFGAQLTTYALTLDIELVLIWILRLWARISEDLGAIEVTELNWIMSKLVI